MVSSMDGLSKELIVRYEVLLRAYKKTKRDYLEVVARTGIDRLAKELNTVLHLDVVFMKYEDDIPVFFLPEVDMREKKALSGAVVRRYNYQAHFSYNKFVEKYKKTIPYFTNLRDSWKILLAFERRNPEFVLEYEKTKLVLDQEFLNRAAIGKAGRTK